MCYTWQVSYLSLGLPGLKRVYHTPKRVLRHRITLYIGKFNQRNRLSHHAVYRWRSVSRWRVFPDARVPLAVGRHHLLRCSYQSVFVHPFEGQGATSSFGTLSWVYTLCSMRKIEFEESSRLYKLRRSSYPFWPGFNRVLLSGAQTLHPVLWLQSKDHAPALYIEFVWQSVESGHLSELWPKLCCASTAIGTRNEGYY